MRALSVLGILLVASAGAQQASVLPEDFDETLLLQRRFTTQSLYTIPMFEGGIELTQESMAEQLDAIGQLLNEQRHTQDPPNLTSVKQMLETQMEAYLLNLHQTAQQSWTTATGLYDDCGTHRERRFHNVTGDVTIAARAMSQARTKHEYCRRSERAWNVFRNMGYTAPVDLAVHTVDDPAIQFCDAVTNAQTAAQTYNDLAPVGKHDCLVDQTAFEYASCAWEAKAREACNAYDTCTTAVGLTALKSRLRVDAAERRALWRTIQILKCRIDELANGAAGTDDGDSEYVDECQNMTISTAHLILNLPDPTPNDCTDEQLPPLTSPSVDDTAQCAVWISTEYTWDASVGVVPTSCTATCVGVHPPNPPADCQDQNSQCAFYRLHPSACGAFQNAALDVCAACCYCQYSPGCGNCPPGYRIHQGGTACQECPEGQIVNPQDSTECVDPEPCDAAVDCSAHGTTNDLDKSNGCECSCTGGWSGVSCNVPPPCDAATHCSGNGATVDADSTDGCVCACDEGYEGDDCSQTSGPAACANNNVGSGWTLVRHVPPGNRWHRARDQLRGTEVYGNPAGGPLSSEEWSITFPSFNQFLFATGDCSKWLICTRDEVMSWYANGLRNILSSSHSATPYQARWYRRQGALEDPWISITDHHPAIGGGMIVYGENHFGSTHAAAILPHHQGANVYVRTV